MQTYRVYWFDGDSHIDKAEWIEAADDQSAQAIVMKDSAGRRWELWRGRARIGSSD